MHLWWETLGLIGHISFFFFILVEWTWLQRSAVRKPLSSRTNQWLLWPWLTAVCISNLTSEHWPQEQTYLFSHSYSYNTEHFFTNLKLKSVHGGMLLTLKSKYWLEIKRGKAHSSVMSETLCLKQTGRSGSLQFNNSTVQVTTSKYRAGFWMSSQIPCPQSPSSRTHPPSPPHLKPPCCKINKLHPRSASQGDPWDALHFSHPCNCTQHLSPSSS